MGGVSFVTQVKKWSPPDEIAEDAFTRLGDFLTIKVSVPKLQAAYGVSYNKADVVRACLEDLLSHYTITPSLVSKPASSLPGEPRTP